VLIALAEEIVEDLFGGNGGLFENFPKAGCGFFIVFVFPLVQLDFD